MSQKDDEVFEWISGFVPDKISLKMKENLIWENLCKAAKVFSPEDNIQINKSLKENKKTFLEICKKLGVSKKNLGIKGKKNIPTLLSELKKIIEKSDKKINKKFQVKILDDQFNATNFGSVIIQDYYLTVETMSQKETSLCDQQLKVSVNPTKKYLVRFNFPSGKQFTVQFVEEDEEQFYLILKKVQNDIKNLDDKSKLKEPDLTTSSFETVDENQNDSDANQNEEKNEYKYQDKNANQNEEKNEYKYQDKNEYKYQDKNEYKYQDKNEYKYQDGNQNESQDEIELEDQNENQKQNQKTRQKNPKEKETKKRKKRKYPKKKHPILYPQISLKLFDIGDDNLQENQSNFRVHVIDQEKTASKGILELQINELQIKLPKKTHRSRYNMYLRILYDMNSKTVIKIQTKYSEFLAQFHNEFEAHKFLKSYNNIRKIHFDQAKVEERERRKEEKERIKEEQERIKAEKEKIRKEQERLKEEQERLARIKEEEEQERLEQEHEKNEYQNQNQNRNQNQNQNQNQVVLDSEIESDPENLSDRFVTQSSGVDSGPDQYIQENQDLEDSPKSRIHDPKIVLQSELETDYGESRNTAPDDEKTSTEFRIQLLSNEYEILEYARLVFRDKIVSIFAQDFGAKSGDVSKIKISHHPQNPLVTKFTFPDLQGVIVSFMNDSDHIQALSFMRKKKANPSANIKNPHTNVPTQNKTTTQISSSQFSVSIYNSKLENIGQGLLNINASQVELQTKNEDLLQNISEMKISLHPKKKEFMKITFKNKSQIVTFESENEHTQFNKLFRQAKRELRKNPQQETDPLVFNLDVVDKQLQNSSRVRIEFTQNQLELLIDGSKKIVSSYSKNQLKTYAHPKFSNIIHLRCHGFDDLISFETSAQKDKFLDQLKTRRTD
ncbi:hypothetical protein M0811_04378 [Anaeramoeba ignava]|uniref:Uncharacterized protein n=1 Tax=Anaeramoeba ignava TaxID=1746090 RepID=A0A9Q0LUW3_ANAIG|nr:hypothetical protein M0811_04378 [Anaeramoeba ignava]